MLFLVSLVWEHAFAPLTGRGTTRVVATKASLELFSVCLSEDVERKVARIARIVALAITASNMHGIIFHAFNKKTCIETIIV